MNLASGETGVEENAMIIETLNQLESIYTGSVPAGAKVSDLDCLIPPYRRMIERSPFFLLATNGSEGLDCSARGDPAGFVRAPDEKTIVFPDRRGNNKIDSLRNIIHDPRVALLFLVPPTGLILRVTGRAQISVADELMSSFAVGNTLPMSVLIVHVESAYMQCARALMRSKLWDASTYVDPASVPSMGDVLAHASVGEIDGAEFDNEAPSRLVRTLW